MPNNVAAEIILGGPHGWCSNGPFNRWFVEQHDTGGVISYKLVIKALFGGRVRIGDRMEIRVALPNQRPLTMNAVYVGPRRTANGRVYQGEEFEVERGVRM